MARVWSLENGETVHEFPGLHMQGTFSPDGRWLLLAEDHEFIFYETGSWNARHRVSSELHIHAAAVFAPDSSMAALRTSLHAVEFIDVESGESLATFANPHLKSMPFCFHYYR